MRVDLLGHGKHVPRGRLRALIIAGEIPLNVAEIAPHSKPRGESAHCGHQFLGLEDLQVLGFGHPSPARLRWGFLGRLRRKRKKEQHVGK